MSSNLRIKITENDLSFILNRWRNLKVEDSFQIDMDYIEKLSKQFNEKELSAEKIELWNEFNKIWTQLWSDEILKRFGLTFYFINEFWTNQL